MFCSVMSCQTPFGYVYEGRCTARSRYSPFQNISFYSTPLYTHSSGLHFPGKHLMLWSSCISPALSSQVPSILLCSPSQYPLLLSATSCNTGPLHTLFSSEHPHLLPSFPLPQELMYYVCMSDNFILLHHRAKEKPVPITSH